MDKIQREKEVSARMTHVGLVTGLEVLVGGLELLGVLDHLINFRARQAADGAAKGKKGEKHQSDHLKQDRERRGEVCRATALTTRKQPGWREGGEGSLVDGDLSLAARGAVEGRDLEETVGVDLERAAAHESASLPFSTPHLS